VRLTGFAGFTVGVVFALLTGLLCGTGALAGKAGRFLTARSALSISTSVVLPDFLKITLPCCWARYSALRDRPLMRLATVMDAYLISMSGVVGVLGIGVVSGRTRMGQQRQIPGGGWPGGSTCRGVFARWRGSSGGRRPDMPACGTSLDGI
jgi:hypothetical protein